MIVTLLLAILLGACLALAAGLWWVADRHRQGRQEIDLRLHEKALASDLRFDVLEERLERVELGQKVSHLHDLLTLAESSRRLTAEACARLRDHLLDLEGEARATGRR